MRFLPRNSGSLAWGGRACSHVLIAERFLVVLDFVSFNSWVDEGARKDESASEAICCTNFEAIENFCRLLIIALINIDLINPYR